MAFSNAMTMMSRSTAFIVALGMVHVSSGTAGAASNQESRPVYAITHRVLTTGGVSNALGHGANALEIDATAWTEGGWYADHDGIVTSRGNKMDEVFERVAREHDEGRAINFVWLDIKNPDLCNGNLAHRNHCSVASLREMARRRLETRGIRVLYGFQKEAAGDVGWGDVNDGLKPLEGVAISGDYEEVSKKFHKYGPDIPDSQRVMDNGFFNPSLKHKSISEQLMLGAEARDRGEVASVFGWTISLTQGATGRSTR